MTLHVRQTPAPLRTEAEAGAGRGDGTRVGEGVARFAGPARDAIPFVHWEGMTMTDTISTETGRTGWRARIAVLGPLALAVLATAAAPAAGADTAFLAPLWLAAIAWTVLASLAGALGRGIRHGDWSAFRRHELPDGRDDRIDWISKTGAYAYLRIQDDHDRLLRDDDHLR